MEEIIARFEIVRLSVKLIDHETIAIQVLKLRDISFDERLNEITDLLEEKNYRQALYMMKGYVASIDDSFFNDKPTFQSKKSKPKPKPKETPSKPQNLFEMTEPKVEKTINLDDMLRMTEESIEDTVEYEEKSIATEEYISNVKEKVESKEPLFKFDNVKKEEEPVEIEVMREVLPKVPEIIERVADNEEPIEEQPVEEETIEEETVEIEKEIVISDNSPEIVIDNILDETKEEEIVEEIVERVVDNEEQQELKEDIVEETNDSNYIDTTNFLEIETTNLHKETIEKLLESKETYEAISEEEVEVEQEVEEKTEVENKGPIKTVNMEMKGKYPPISYIDQKFRNMRHQFPQIEESENGIVEEAKVLLKKIATQGYTEEDVKSAIVQFQKYKQAGKKAEAAQMLILAAASESKYAQLLLARELFKGEVLEIDYPEAFTQINRLSEHDYPEAICDLAQLYEYGYGIKKDKKTAILLYEEAAEMGIDRAEKHLERLTKKKGMFSSFFK